MRRLSSILSILAVFLIGLAGCGTISGDDFGKESETFLEAVTDEVIAYSDTEESFISFKANKSWRVSTDASWFTLEPSCGEGSDDMDDEQIVIVSIEPNATGSLRYGYILVEAAESSVLIPVIQSQYTESACPEKPVIPVVTNLSLETGDLSFGCERGSRNAVFKTDGAWKITCDKAWVSLSAYSGNASDESQSVAVGVPYNSVRNAERTATVTITSGSSSVSFAVSQEPSADKSAADFLERVYRENYTQQYFCAHRANTYEGMFRDFTPENTSMAIEKCVDAGIEMCEIDGRLTADGVVVCIHDDDIRNVTTGSGAVSSLTYGQICAYDMIMRNNGIKVKGVHLNTLEEVLAAAKDRIWVNLDFSKDKSDDFIVAASKIITDLGMEDQVLIYVGGDTAAAKKYYQCIGRKIAFNFYALGDSAVTSIASATACQFGGWDDGYESRYPTIRTNGCCSFANMINHDSTVYSGKGQKYMDLFISCRIDFMQTDVADCDVLQKYLKSKKLR